MKRNTVKRLAIAGAAVIGVGAVGFGAYEAFGPADPLSCAAYAPDASKFGAEINGPNGNNFDMFPQIGMAVLRCAQNSAGHEGTAIDDDNKGAIVSIDTLSGAQVEFSVNSSATVDSPDFARDITDVMVSTFPAADAKSHTTDGTDQWDIDYSPHRDPGDPLQDLLRWDSETFPGQSLDIGRDSIGNLYMQDQNMQTINDPTNAAAIGCSAMQMADAMTQALTISPNTFAPYLPLLPGGIDTSGSCERK